MTLSQCWELARLWYRGRHEADWRRGSTDEALAVFREIGLDGPFWELG